MSIKELAANIRFGVASPAYQSRSVGTDFEGILLQIRDELKVAEMHYREDLLAAGDMFSEKSGLRQKQVPALFRMDATEISLLDDLLMMALEDIRLSGNE